MMMTLSFCRAFLFRVSKYRDSKPEMKKKRKTCVAVLLRSFFFDNTDLFFLCWGQIEVFFLSLSSSSLIMNTRLSISLQ